MVNIHVKNEIHPAVLSIATFATNIPPMNIAKIRRARGMTQSDLAELANTTQPTVSRAEHGDDSTTMGTLKDIAAALNVDLHDLFAPARPDAEDQILKVFRQLPEDRQRGWLDMALLAAATPPSPSQ